MLCRDGRVARARARLEPILSSLTGSAQLEQLLLGSAQSFLSFEPYARISSGEKYLPVAPEITIVGGTGGMHPEPREGK